MTDPLARARADLREGRPWKARDRLTGMLAHRQDPELVDLLAEIHHEMRDLPAAGALWFVTGRSDERANEAIAAWRERYGNEESRWSSLPKPLRESPQQARVRELQREAKSRAQARWQEQRSAWRQAQSSGWSDRLDGCLLAAFVIWMIAMIIIGFVTVVIWAWP